MERLPKSLITLTSSDFLLEFAFLNTAMQVFLKQENGPSPV